MYFNASKLIVSLPSTLEPNTIYFVRVGDGFDLYCSDALGNVAHKVNSNTDNVVPNFVATVGNGINNVYTVTHNLNSIDVIVNVFYNEFPYEDVVANVRRIDSNNVQLEFAQVIPLNKIRVIVIGDSGAKGRPCYSAYEIAVQNGFNGTEQQWLESIKPAYNIDGGKANSNYGGIQMIFGGNAGAF